MGCSLVVVHAGYITNLVWVYRKANIKRKKHCKPCGYNCKKVRQHFSTYMKKSSAVQNPSLHVTNTPKFTLDKTKISEPKSATFGGCDTRNNLMPGQRASNPNLIVMPQRCSAIHGICIGDQHGCQARVFCIPTRPKSEPKSATFRGCDSRNNQMSGQRASRSHLPLIVMPKRCSVIHGIGIGDGDGCQARVFCIPTRPKF